MPTSPPVAGAPPVTQLPPLWAALALILSGIVIIVVETFSLLVLLGLVFLIVGIYVLYQRRVARSNSS
jgi:membrane-bound ClpP family serine protease